MNMQDTQTAMTQPTLELKSRIIKEAWLDFATLFDASDVFTNL